MYTATAGSPSATSALVALGDSVAAQQTTRATVHNLVPFTKDDPRDTGMTAALLPMIFGGIFPALILSSVFPGHRGLRTRIVEALLFSLVAGAAVAAVLQFATHSVDGNYGLTALGLILGTAALSTTLLGLQALLGMAGFAFGGALMMLLGNPLSGLATGPTGSPPAGPPSASSSPRAPLAASCAPAPSSTAPEPDSRPSSWPSGSVSASPSRFLPTSAAGAPPSPAPKQQPPEPGLRGHARKCSFARAGGSGDQSVTTPAATTPSMTRSSLVLARVRSWMSSAMRSRSVVS